ncbi:hypothetical protein CAL7716_101890 (plasmid) [Calothrix sp. PCC 7716]|nr:hypothetical protein CAL7716_101890 [Calothrix sp. PCC 7716]
MDDKLTSPFVDENSELAKAGGVKNTHTAEIVTTIKVRILRKAYFLKLIHLFPTYLL